MLISQTIRNMRGYSPKVQLLCSQLSLWTWSSPANSHRGSQVPTHTEFQKCSRKDDPETWGSSQRRELLYPDSLGLNWSSWPDFSLQLLHLLGPGYVGIHLCLLHLMCCDPDVFWPVVTASGSKIFSYFLCLRSVMTLLSNTTSLWGITCTHPMGCFTAPSVLHQARVKIP